MKKKLCVFLLIALFVLSGCKNKNSNNNQEKIEGELSYIEDKIFILAGKLNNLYAKDYTLISKEIEIKKEEENSSKKEENSEEEAKNSNSKEEKSSYMEMEKVSILGNKDTENEIDWKDIKIEIESINNLWSIISIDLKTEKVADNDIEKFSNDLNQTLLSVKTENKAETLKNIEQLYSSIPIFMQYGLNENYKLEIKKVKLEVLKAYTEASLNNWDNVTNHIANAENIFFNIQKGKNLEDKKSKIDKMETLLKNLNISSKTQDLQVFLVNYKILIENLNAI